MWAWWPRRSNSVVVRFSSPKTWTHSENARFVMTIADRRSEQSANRLEGSSSPARSKGTKPSWSTISNATRR